MPRRDHTYWEIPVDPEVLARLPATEPEPPRDPEKQQAIDEAVAQLHTIIQSGLTPRQREIVQAYFFEGRTEAEIALQLGIAQQVVSRHLFGVLRAGSRAAISALRSLAAIERYRAAVLDQLVRMDLTSNVEALLQEYVRSGTKDEAVAATRALCGYRLINWGKPKQTELAAAGAVHAGGVHYWIRRDAKVGPDH